MKNNPHNFYRPEDILYILENKKYWLSHYEFRSDGIYKQHTKNLKMFSVDFNNVCDDNTPGILINKITGKTYNWFI